MTALGLPLSRAYKKPSEPKAVILKSIRSFCIMTTFWEQIEKIASKTEDLQPVYWVESRPRCDQCRDFEVMEAGQICAHCEKEWSRHYQVMSSAPRNCFIPSLSNIFAKTGRAFSSSSKYLVVAYFMTSPPRFLLRVVLFWPALPNNVGMKLL